MARISINATKVSILLTPRERRLIARPNIQVDTNRITAVSVKEDLDPKSLGTRLSSRPWLNRQVGLYQKGQQRIVVLIESFSSDHGYIVMKINHPTLDEIWIRSKSAVESVESLQKNQGNRKN